MYTSKESFVSSSHLKDSFTKCIEKRLIARVISCVYVDCALIQYWPFRHYWPPLFRANTEERVQYTFLMLQ